MKKMFTKTLAAILTLSMLPLPNATVSAYAAGDTGQYVSSDNVNDTLTGNLIKASASDAEQNDNSDFIPTNIEESFSDRSLIEEGLERFDVSEISLDEYELDYGARHGMKSDEKESDSKIKVYNSGRKNDSISPLYDRKSRRRMRKLIRGGSDLTRYIAEQLTFGVTPIRIDKRFSEENPYVTFEDILGAIREASWQNQLIMEEDFFPYEIEYGGRIKNLTSYSNEYGIVEYYTFEVNYTYPNIAQRKAKQLELLDKAEEIIDEIGIYSNGTRIEEVYAINNYIIDHAYYDKDVYDGSRGINVLDTDSRKANGVLLNGKGVCSSYARAFQFVTTMAGFHCLVDAGDAKIWQEKPSDHAWNLVYSRDDKYLMVDPTWNDDDNVINVPRNTFLMIPYNNTYRLRRSDKRTFANRGKYKWADLAYSDNYGFDYMNYVGKYCDSDQLDQLLLAYVQKGYFPDCVRYEGYMDDGKLAREIRQFLDILANDPYWAGFTVYKGWDPTKPKYVILDLEKNENRVKLTKRGYYEIVDDGSGQWIDKEMEYTGPRGTKPEPEPEITEEERREDEEEARRQEEERRRQEEEQRRQEEEQRRQEEEQRRQEEEQRRQNQGSGGGSGSGGGGGGGSRSGGGGGGGSRSGGGGGGGSRSGGGGGGGSRSGGGGSRSGGEGGNTKKDNNSSSGWKQDSRGWWYQNTDGSYPRNAWVKIGATWYLFNSSGYALTGWQKVNGQWYYMNSSCAMITGWVGDGGKWYYMSEGGAMTTNAWVKSLGKWYYVGGDGAMLTNTRTPDGYMVKADGSL